MIDQILELVKQYGQQHVVQNQDVPNEYNNAVMAEAGKAVTGSLQQSLASGNISNLMQLFNSDNDSEIMSSPVAEQAQTGFIENITSKLGINRNTAMSIGAALLPLILTNLVKRTRSSAPQDNNFDLQSLIGQLTGGGNQSGIGNLISHFTNNRSESQPGLDFEDVLRQVTHGAREQQQTGGLNDLVRGFFK